MIRRTVCRVCESGCGLLATVEHDRVIELRPDRGHPVSKGYACAKGLRFHQLHHSENRLKTPIFRDSGADAFQAIGWGEARGHLAEQLGAVIARHGTQSVGVFSGNAVVNSLGAVLGVSALVDGLKTPRHYSSLTLDNSEMFVVLEECLGSALLTFTADYANSDCVALFGTDVLSSQPSQAQSHPNGVRELLGVAARDQLVVVDPRRSMTARKASLHLQSRPSSDVALLSWLIREALAFNSERQEREPLLDMADVAEMAQAVASFDVERVVRVTGLSESELEAFRDRLLAAERPLVWGGLGLLLSPHGTVAWWLTLVLQAILGGLDVSGGWRCHGGAVDVPWLGRRLGLRAANPSLTSPVGGYPSVLGTVASATLTADIEQGGLKALIVVGGNPAVSLPSAARARAALASLELLVCVDPFVNATGELAHIVLPTRTWLTRPQVAVHIASQRSLPHFERLEPVVAPVGESREDWDILLDLARCAGVPAFGSRVADRILRWASVRPSGIARLAVGVAGRIRWSQARDGGGMAPQRAMLRENGTELPSRQVLLAVPRFVAALKKWEMVEGEGLQLVTSVRPVGSMNTWIGSRPPGVATIHPADAARLELNAGMRVQVRGEATVELALVVDDRIRQGCVLVPWGVSEDGVNINDVIGTDRLEPFTGQPISNGQWVSLRAV